jgi:hypothetical protein
MWHALPDLMLVIRNEQLAAMGEVREADFRRRVLNHLRGLRDRRTLALNDNELEQQMAAGLKSGRRFFTAERDLVRYLEIVLTRMGGWHGTDHPPRVLSLLAGRSLPGGRRLDNLERWLVRRGRPHV